MATPVPTLPPRREVLRRQTFTQIVAELQDRRLNDFNTIKDRLGKKGQVLGFIRGLRVSALLITAINEVLMHSELTAAWGHIIDEEADYCSRECDIIIYKKEPGSVIQEWNGDRGTGVMDFRFINKSSVKVVISCKSYLTPSKIDKDYPALIAEFVDNIWLFAECCNRISTEKILRQAKTVGYGNFWYFYDISRGEYSPNEEGWINFVEEIFGLV